MTQFLLDMPANAVAAWPVPVPATSIGLDTLLSSLTPNLDGIAGLFAFTVLAMVAIAWLTAAPSARRPTTGRRDQAAARPAGAAAIV